MVKLASSDARYSTAFAISSGVPARLRGLWAPIIVEAANGPISAEADEILNKNGAVIVGVIAMAVNGKLNKNHSNKLMRLRVLFQAIAVLVFVTIIWLSRN